jgi:hypothetical protein
MNGHVALLLGVLYLTTLVAGQHQECAVGMQQCMTQYLQAMAKSPKNVDNDALCRAVGVFMQCLFGLSCDLPEEVKQGVVNKAKEEMRARDINCDFDIPTNPEPGTKSNKPLQPKPNQVGHAVSSKVISLTAGQSAECGAGVQTCSLQYFQNVTRGGGDVDNAVICRDAGNFLQCVFGRNCILAGQRKMDLIFQVGNEIRTKGVQCDPDALANPPKKPMQQGDKGNSATATMGTFFIIAMAGVLSFYCLQAL